MGKFGGIPWSTGAEVEAPMMEEALA